MGTVKPVRTTEQALRDETLPNGEIGDFQPVTHADTLISQLSDQQIDRLAHRTTYQRNK